MINNDTAKSTYTVTEGVTEYPIGFQYLWNENNQPQILVYVGPEANRYLEYGTDFTVSDDGLSVVLSAEIEAGTKLSIMSDVPFIQDSNYVVGRIDPEQIERDFDKSVLRDLQLRDYADDINDRLEDEVQARTDADAALQDAIDDEVEARSLADTTLQNNIDAEADAREDADAALQTAINAKQDIIVDLANIRSGAAAGATAVQPSDLSTVATTGSYNDLSNKPRYAASIRLSIDPSTFVVTAQLKDQDNNNIGTAQTIDLPLESVVVSGAYDSATREVVLTLEGGSTIRFSVADLVSGLQTEITSSNKLDADLVDDSTSANKFVTSAEKTAISTAVQRGDNVSDLTNDAGYVTSTDVATDYVAKAGDTMSGALNIVNPNGTTGTLLKLQNGTTTNMEWEIYSRSDMPILGFRNASGGLSGGLGFMISSYAIYPAQATLGTAIVDLGTSTNPWKTLYTTKINNGADIAVPTSGGTMARVEDLPDTTHMVTDNTAQNISAAKTFVAANPSATTSQTTVANYAVKFGRSDNNDLFSISADTNTSTLSIVGDNASNIIDMAASGAVLNHFQVSSSDVTFGGNSLINPDVMTGADGTNAGTSGLVPAPAATDNDKFLSGDGTWKAAGGGLPDQTGNAGKFLTTDGTDASWSDKPLVNNATGVGRLAVGDSATASQNLATSYGVSAAANSNGSTAVGSTASAQGNYSVALGAKAQTNAKGAIQINASGLTNTNSDANTFKVANANGNFEIMSADGTIPEARLADTTNAAQGQVLTLDSNLNAVWQAGSGGSAPITEVHTGSAVAPTAEGTNSLAVGNNAQATQIFGSGENSTAIGNNSFSYPYGVSVGTSASNSGYGVAVGASAAADTQGIAIGAGVTSGSGGIILGGYGVSTTGTDHAFDIVLNHYEPIAGINRHEKYTICDIDGHFPPDRLASTMGLADGNYRLRLVMASGVPTLEWVAE